MASMKSFRSSMKAGGISKLPDKFIYTLTENLANGIYRIYLCSIGGYFSGNSWKRRINTYASDYGLPDAHQSGRRNRIKLVHCRCHKRHRRDHLCSKEIG